VEEAETVVVDTSADAGGKAGESSESVVQEAERQKAEWGCHSITSRDDCCLYIDGRTDEWGGHKCLPAAPGVTFATGNVCEPQVWVDANPEIPAGSCAKAEVPPATEPEVAAAAATEQTAGEAEAERQKAEWGCHSITSRDDCCLYVDGRDDEWGGQKCLPAAPGVTFATGNVCEPQVWVDAHPESPAGSCAKAAPAAAGEALPAEDVPARP
jgi:hypothetical protein